MMTRLWDGIKKFFQDSLPWFGHGERLADEEEALLPDRKPVEMIGLIDLSNLTYTRLALEPIPDPDPWDMSPGVILVPRPASHRQLQPPKSCLRNTEPTGRNSTPQRTVAFSNQAHCLETGEEVPPNERNSAQLHAEIDPQEELPPPPPPPPPRVPGQLGRRRRSRYSFREWESPYDLLELSAAEDPGLAADELVVFRREVYDRLVVAMRNRYRLERETRNDPRLNGRPLPAMPFPFP